MDPGRLTPLPLPAAIPAQVQVWLLDAVSDELRLDGLDHAERERCLRFRQHGDRTRFAQTRRALRALLGERLGVAPEALLFTTGQHGKPLLAGSSLQFNVSHSGRYALIAIAAHAPVGVDLQHIDRERPLSDLAERYYSAAEQAAGLADPDILYHLWSCKEAVVKAWGTGIGNGLPSLEGEMDAPVFDAAADGPAQHRARVWRIGAPDGYAAALAIA